MSKVIVNPILAKPRIVNFSNITLPGDRVLLVNDTDLTGIIEKIREHSDLPYVWVVEQKDESLVNALLVELQKIRSTCYPHALFSLGESFVLQGSQDVTTIPLDFHEPEKILEQIDAYALDNFSFDLSTLAPRNDVPVPGEIDVLIIGAGITGLYAASRLEEKNISFCLIEERGIAGGIWSKYANSTSQVNTSEAAYRLIERKNQNEPGSLDDSRSSRGHAKSVGRL